jgi:hypothetical protein
VPDIVDDEAVPIAPAVQVNSLVGDKPVTDERLVEEVPTHPRIGDTEGVEGQIFRPRSARKGTLKLNLAGGGVLLRLMEVTPPHIHLAEVQQRERLTPSRK